GGLLGGDAEEGRVEGLDVVQEAALADVGRAGGVGVGVVQRLHVPAPGGERSDRVPALGEQPPQGLRVVGTAGQPAGRAHHGDGFVGGRGAGGGRGARGGGPGPGGEDTGEQVGGEPGRGGVVEQQGGGEPGPDAGADAVAEVDGGHRVHAEVAQRLVGADRVRAGEAE